MGRTAVACPLVDTPEVREDVKASFHLSDEIMSELFIPGDDSTESTCDVCTRRIWIGNKQVEAWGDGEDVSKICFLCVVVVQTVRRQYGMPEPEFRNLSTGETF